MAAKNCEAMIVKYSRLRIYKGAGDDPHLTIGKNYIVFALTIRSNSAEYPELAAVQSDGALRGDGPALFPLSLFDFVDERIPPYWVLHPFQHFGATLGHYDLCPRELAGSF
jgi:hypothetical protein